MEHLEAKWLWVQEKVSEKAIRLRKRSTETNIADLATKYSARPRMEMLLATGDVVLVSGERERNGQYVLENSVQKQFPIIVVLFLGLGIIFMSMLLYVDDKQDGYQFDCIDGERDSDQLDQEFETAENKKAGSDKLERNGGHSPCSSTDEVFINTVALRSMLIRHEYFDLVSFGSGNASRFTDGVLLLENVLKTGKSRPVVERLLEGTSTDSVLHPAWASCGWSLVTPETLGLFSNVLSPVAVCRSVSPHIEEACERARLYCLFEGLSFVRSVLSS